MDTRKLATKGNKPLVDNLWKQISTFILDVFWPVRCSHCSKIGHWLCYTCFSTLETNKQICFRCQESAIGGFTHKRCLKPRGLDRLWSPYLYKGAAKSLLATFKYSHCPSVSVVIAGLIVETFSDDLSVLSDFTLVPVPLHRLKLVMRGYDQAVLLSKNLSDLWNVPVEENLLERRTYTISQTSLNKDQRRKNVVNAFAIKDSKKCKVRGGKFILIDDVCTTASTLSACCACLKRAGADTVWGITFAKD